MKSAAAFNPDDSSKLFSSDEMSEIVLGSCGKVIAKEVAKKERCCDEILLGKAIVPSSKPLISPGKGNTVLDEMQCQWPGQIVSLPCLQLLNDDQVSPKLVPVHATTPRNDDEYAAWSIVNFAIPFSQKQPSTETKEIESFEPSANSDVAISPRHEKEPDIPEKGLPSLDSRPVIMALPFAHNPSTAMDNFSSFVEAPVIMPVKPNSSIHDSDENTFRGKAHLFMSDQATHYLKITPSINLSSSLHAQSADIFTVSRATSSISNEEREDLSKAHDAPTEKPFLSKVGFMSVSQSPAAQKLTIKIPVDPDLAVSARSPHFSSRVTATSASKEPISVSSDLDALGEWKAHMSASRPQERTGSFPRHVSAAAIVKNEVRRSCDNCARMKKKCDGHQPCLFCSRLQLHCRYRFKLRPGPLAKCLPAAERRRRVARSVCGDADERRTCAPHVIPSQPLPMKRGHPPRLHVLKEEVDSVIKKKTRTEDSSEPFSSSIYPQLSPTANLVSTSYRIADHSNYQPLFPKNTPTLQADLGGIEDSQSSCLQTRCGSASTPGLLPFQSLRSTELNTSVQGLAPVSSSNASPLSVLQQEGIALNASIGGFRGEKSKKNRRNCIGGQAIAMTERGFPSATRVIVDRPPISAATASTVKTFEDEFSFADIYMSTFHAHYRIASEDAFSFGWNFIAETSAYASLPRQTAGYTVFISLVQSNMHEGLCAALTWIACAFGAAAMQDPRTTFYCDKATELIDVIIRGSDDEAMPTAHPVNKLLVRSLLALELARRVSHRLYASVNYKVDGYYVRTVGKLITTKFPNGVDDADDVSLLLIRQLNLLNTVYEPNTPAVDSLLNSDIMLRSLLDSPFYTTTHLHAPRNLVDPASAVVLHCVKVCGEWNQVLTTLRQCPSLFPVTGDSTGCVPKNCSSVRDTERAFIVTGAGNDSGATDGLVVRPESPMIDFIKELSADLDHLKIMEASIGRDKDPMSFLILLISVNLRHLAMRSLGEQTLVFLLSDFRFIADVVSDRVTVVNSTPVWHFLHIVACVLFQTDIQQSQQLCERLGRVLIRTMQRLCPFETVGISKPRFHRIAAPFLSIEEFKRLSASLNPLELEEHLLRRFPQLSQMLATDRFEETLGSSNVHAGFPSTHSTLLPHTDEDSKYSLFSLPPNFLQGGRGKAEEVPYPSQKQRFKMLSCLSMDHIAHILALAQPFPLLQGLPLRGSQGSVDPISSTSRSAEAIFSPTTIIFDVTASPPPEQFLDALCWQRKEAASGTAQLFEGPTDSSLSNGVLLHCLVPSQCSPQTPSVDISYAGHLSLNPLSSSSMRAGSCESPNRLAKDTNLHVTQPLPQWLDSAEMPLSRVRSVSAKDKPADIGLPSLPPELGGMFINFDRPPFSPPPELGGSFTDLENSHVPPELWDAKIRSFLPLLSSSTPI